MIGVDPGKTSIVKTVYLDTNGNYKFQRFSKREYNVSNSIFIIIAKEFM